MDMKLRMGKRAVSRIVMTGILLVGAITAGQAQDVFAPSDAWADENDPRYYENVIDRNWQLIQQEQWADIFSNLAEDAALSEVDWSGAQQVHERFLDALDASIDELKEIDALYNGVYLEHLDQLHTGRFAEGIAGDGFVAFMGMNPAIVLCMEGAEQANPCNQPQHPILTVAQARDVRYRANAANELLLILRREADEVILDAIETSYKRWNNFLDNGFVMYPWEITLNSALLEWDIRTPPSTQFIFLHPSLGIQIPLDGFSDPVKFRAKESLVIEVAGHLWYRGEFLDNYGGISGTVVLREDLPPGFGFLLRPGRGLSAGLNWHLSADEQKQFMKTPFVTVSVNVLNFIKSNRGRFEL
ncbi:hypothetical protein [Rhodohalobacter sp. 8-1]|uniref:hypothetical protein n=1 Tax=Rhodohalobacter sp. 8-1 TaxID=3131972 RepID=UPI0030ED8E1D